MDCYRIGRFGGGIKGRRGGVSPYGPKGSPKNWSEAEKRELARGVSEILQEIAEETGVPWQDIVAPARKGLRDKARIAAVQAISKRLDVSAAVIAKCLACHRTTVVTLLRGGKRKAPCRPNSSHDRTLATQPAPQDSDS